ncbi:MAG: hypothetical protein LKI80_06320 [Sporolactobacillus sp.]|nr:hypothetical protein [Sporolactobacillus sp.]
MDSDNEKHGSPLMGRSRSDCERIEMMADLFSCFLLAGYKMILACPQTYWEKAGLQCGNKKIGPPVC